VLAGTITQALPVTMQQIHDSKLAADLNVAASASLGGKFIYRQS
jgi:hypothetical protein